MLIVFSDVARQIVSIFVGQHDIKNAKIKGIVMKSG